MNEVPAQLVGPALPQGQARVVVTYEGQTGDLADPISADTSHPDVLRMVEEAIRTGGIRGIPAKPDASLQGFIVDPAAPNDVHPYPRLLVRPKTAFGMPDMGGAGPCTCWKFVSPTCPQHGRT